VFFLECHHAIGKPIASPLSDYTWERIALGDGHDDGYAALDDLRLVQARELVMKRPDVIGARIVFQSDALAAVGGQAVPFTDGQIVATFGQ